MFKLTLTLSTLVLMLLTANAQAHNNRYSRGHYDSFHNNSWYSPYPATGLIAGISFRSYNSRIGLQNRLESPRLGNQRSYQRGYRNGYRDARRDYSDHYQPERYSSQSCYEISYDRFGNRIRRSLPPSACRH